MIILWWGRLELNQPPSGYEPPALTDELRPLVSGPYKLGSCQAKTSFACLLPSSPGRFLIPTKTLFSRGPLFPRVWEVFAVCNQT